MLVGNETSTQVKTKKIEYTITPLLTTWTNDKTTIQFLNLVDCTITYNLGGGANLAYNNATGIEVSQNATINYTLQDGNNTITGQIGVTNIDKTAPTISVTSDYYKVTINGTDARFWNYWLFCNRHRTKQYKSSNIYKRDKYKPIRKTSNKRLFGK